MSDDTIRAQQATDAEQNTAITALEVHARRRERVLFWLAVLGFVVTAVSAGVSLLQWQVMRVQADDARTAMRLEHRPWILIQSAEIALPIAAGDKPRIRLHVLNSGHTPAMNVTVLHHFRRNTTAEIPMTRKESMNVLVAGDVGVVEVTAAEAATEKQVDDAARGLEVQLPFSGYILYRDVFRDLHETAWCYRIEIARAERRLVPCRENNWAN